ncbi:MULTISPECIES: Fic family protein [Prevotellaceae]|uniref:Fic family protein n=1 Tax=Prevotellaceae TaxID=171552 RepID=UPI000B1B82BE|nr:MULTISPECIES: Fic family protein [Prevotellaceae]QVJ80902.1 Fic family protein [Xylanibacter ruminicola]
MRLVSEISEQVGIVTTLLGDNVPSPMLRKANRIKTIHSSLAIEHNTLSLKQVTDIIDGKHVLGAPDEIQEVKNALQAYHLMSQLDAFKEKDLLRAHELMMLALVDNAGCYRHAGVGVFDGDKCIHMAPPADRVPALMADLFEWIKKTDVHPLVSSCVFHYEFEFIHPFIDGNGRMGRYWQTMLLSKWKGIFSWIPVETIVKEHQQEYYDVIAKCDAAGSSTVFIEFMLRCLLDAMKRIEEEPEEVPNKVPNKLPNKLRLQYPDLSDAVWDVYLELMEDGHASAATVGSHLGISDRMVRKHISVLRDAGIIERIGGNKTGYWKLLKK